MMRKTHIKQTAIEEHHLDIGHFIFYPNIIVGELKEEVHVTFETAALAIQLATQVYGVKDPVVYISHRINSYSQDLNGYREIAELFPNFKGFAVVANTKRRRVLANLERFFIKKPMRVFDNLESAMKWADELLTLKN